MVSYNVYLPGDTKKNCITAIKKDMIYFLPVATRRPRTAVLDKLQNPRLGPFFSMSHYEFVCLRTIVRDCKALSEGDRNVILESLDVAAAGKTPSVQQV